MKILRRLFLTAAATGFVFAAGLWVAWIITEPEELQRSSESSERLGPGRHQVGHLELEWVDNSRNTASNGDFPGAPHRRFPVALWFPQDFDDEHPLVVYSHGFMSTRHGGAYLAKHLASHGYVVVSADFPLTRLGAPGGPNFLDVVHQASDVSFLIDRVLGLEEQLFEGSIDRARIGAFGLSLGGATTTLVAFHPVWRDPRLTAAISIAGPGDVFGRRFFDHAAIPFLMVAGTADAIVDYESNALVIPDRIRYGGLVSIEGGTHTGFAQLMAGMPRILGNPDNLVCMTAGLLGDAPPENVFTGLFGTPDQGLVEVTEYRPPCSRTFFDTMQAGRQQMITTLAVRAFFESRFARDPEERASHEVFLERTLSLELSDVRYTPARR